jgi:hypothetical protein
MTYQLKGNVVLGSNVIGYYDSSIAGFFSNTYISGGYLNVYSSFQGSTYGYATGGEQPIGGAGSTGKQRYAFANNNYVEEWGSLRDLRKNHSGQQSTSYGYASYGTVPGTGSPAPTDISIEKFSFSNASESGLIVGAAPGNTLGVSGHSSYTEGYISSASSILHNIGIVKFSFSTDSDGTFVGDLANNKVNACGQSSTAYGYSSGGGNTPLSATTNSIDKFPFSSDGNASDIADITVSRGGSSGQSSANHGYSSGGATPTRSNVIDKFPFASDNNAVDVGDLDTTVVYSSGTSSNTDGYAAGGTGPGPGVSTTATKTIRRFPFATDVNATNVGDLLQGLVTEKSAGVQV